MTMGTVDVTMDGQHPRLPIPPSWCVFVDPERRRDLISILAELSGLWEGMVEPFIIVGALSLVLRERLRFTALWDIDLLFPSEEAVETFADRRPPGGVRVVAYDDQLMRGAGIASLHTAWRICSKWINVDYIYRPPFYRLHYSTFEKDGPLIQEVRLGEETFQIRVPVAHPWDVFLEKIISPRFSSVVESGYGMHPDVRHILFLLQSETEQEGFWSYLEQTARVFGLVEGVRQGMELLLANRDYLGYGEFELPAVLDAKIGRFGR
ncbi:hypothetical protein AMJ39_06640 [candidate division TA06 bacterium DG_24]|nr:MAG: hypothetical protein AMJ39_06640 [candidate division TA06 bacterium DG_24]KPL10079.1 MAG: hypothetical protein AMJ71_04465 [candidate division TA06 bacterium SM1_40]